MQISRHPFRLAFGEAQLPLSSLAPPALPAIVVAQAGQRPNTSDKGTSRKQAAPLHRTLGVMHTITYTPTLALVRSASTMAPHLFPSLATHLALLRRRQNIFGVPLTIAAVVLVLAAPGIATSKMSQSSVALLVWALLILTIGMAIGFLVKLTSPGSDFLLISEVPVTFTLTTEAVAIESDGARSTFPWRHILRVRVSDDFVFLATSESALYVPTGAFPSREAMESFAAFASSKAGNDA
jgi:hypothetical protein